MIFNRVRIFNVIVIFTLLAVSIVGCNGTKKDSKEVVLTTGGSTNLTLEESKVKSDKETVIKPMLPKPDKVNLYKNGNVKEMHLGQPITEKFITSTEMLVNDASFKDNRVWASFAGIYNYDMVVELIFDEPIKFNFETKTDDTITHIYLVRDGEETIFFARYSFLNNKKKAIEEVGYATILHTDSGFWETVENY